MENDDKAILKQVQIAIDENRIEDARDLLRPLMKRNVVEAFHFASRVAYTQEQALEFLNYALQLEPDNEIVREQLNALQGLYQSQNQAIVATSPTKALIEERVSKTVDLFRQNGWKVLEQTGQTAHLSLRHTIHWQSAFLAGLLLHVPGLILISLSLLTSQKIHVFIDADENDILLTTTKGDHLLTQPQQAIIFIEKLRSTKIWVAPHNNVVML